LKRNEAKAKFLDHLKAMIKSVKETNSSCK
jgi:hypothetical protein